MNSMIKIHPGRLPAPRLAPTKAVRINTVEDKDLRRMQEYAERVRDYEQLKQHHERKQAPHQGKTKAGRPVSIWTKDRKEALIRMIEEDKSSGEIAEVLGVSKHQIFSQKSRLRSAGAIGKQRERQANGWKETEDGQLISLYKRGAGITFIAQQVGRTEQACLYRLKTLRSKGVNIPFRGPVLDKLAPGRGDD